MKLILETGRLYARRFELTDTAFILRLLNTPGWLQFIGDRKVYTEEEATTYLLSVPLKSYHENGFGLCLIALKSNNEPIGMCGLIKREALHGVDIGFAFLPEFTGKGYATEIAAATMQHARDILQIPVVLAIVLPSNIKSIRLLKKIGMHYQKQITLPTDAVPVMLFSTNNGPVGLA
ncbi:MAG: GNAT family N-acetyltransferase [Bacteroidota bacterium]